ncbi:hypothetical protein PR048_021070 [Dryococelus australis]|uniref:Uncharacterized protein n=1 Tax=Dryococelus australis TaxID=614101 RepID=A0ABQ9GX79_9NEOP|nr:hypothetical protein PR048_021070 [Dryococelus australis]
MQRERESVQDSTTPLDCQSIEEYVTLSDDCEGTRADVEASASSAVRTPRSIIPTSRDFISRYAGQLYDSAAASVGGWFSEKGGSSRTSGGHRRPGVVRNSPRHHGETTSPTIPFLAVRRTPRFTVPRPPPPSPTPIFSRAENRGNKFYGDLAERASAGARKHFYYSLSAVSCGQTAARRTVRRQPITVFDLRSARREFRREHTSLLSESRSRPAATYVTYAANDRVSLLASVPLLADTADESLTMCFEGLFWMLHMLLKLPMYRTDCLSSSRRQNMVMAIVNVNQETVTLICQNAITITMVPHDLNLSGSTYFQFLEDLSAEHFEEVTLDARGPIAWPPRSPDIAPPDFCLRGHTKSTVCATPLGTRDELITWIRRAADIINATLQPMHMCVATCFSAALPEWAIVADTLNRHLAPMGEGEKQFVLFLPYEAGAVFCCAIKFLPLFSPESESWFQLRPRKQEGLLSIYEPSRVTLIPGCGESRLWATTHLAPKMLREQRPEVDQATERSGGRKMSTLKTSTNVGNVHLESRGSRFISSFLLANRLFSRTRRLSSLTSRTKQSFQLCTAPDSPRDFCPPQPQSRVSAFYAPATQFPGGRRGRGGKAGVKYAFRSRRLEQFFLRKGDLPLGRGEDEKRREKCERTKAAGRTKYRVVKKTIPRTGNLLLTTFYTLSHQPPLVVGAAPGKGKEPSAVVNNLPSNGALYTAGGGRLSGGADHCSQSGYPPASFATRNTSPASIEVISLQPEALVAKPGLCSVPRGIPQSLLRKLPTVDSEVIAHFQNTLTDLVVLPISLAGTLISQEIPLRTLYNFITNNEHGNVATALVKAQSRSKPLRETDRGDSWIPTACQSQPAARCGSHARRMDEIEVEQRRSKDARGNESTSRKAPTSLRCPPPSTHEISVSNIPACRGLTSNHEPHLALLSAVIECLATYTRQWYTYYNNCLKILPREKFSRLHFPLGNGIRGARPHQVLKRSSLSLQEQKLRHLAPKSEDKAAFPPLKYGCKWVSLSHLFLRGLTKNVYCSLRIDSAKDTLVTTTRLKQALKHFTNDNRCQTTLSEDDIPSLSDGWLTRQQPKAFQYPWLKELKEEGWGEELTVKPLCSRPLNRLPDFAEWERTAQNRHDSATGRIYTRSFDLKALACLDMLRSPNSRKHSAKGNVCAKQLTFKPLNLGLHAWVFEQLLTGWIQGSMRRANGALCVQRRTSLSVHVFTTAAAAAAAATSVISLLSAHHRRSAMPGYRPPNWLDLTFTPEGLNVHRKVPNTYLMKLPSERREVAISLEWLSSGNIYTKMSLNFTTQCTTSNKSLFHAHPVVKKPHISPGWGMTSGGASNKLQVNSTTTLFNRESTVRPLAHHCQRLAQSPVRPLAARMRGLASSRSRNTPFSVTLDHMMPKSRAAERLTQSTAGGGKHERGQTIQERTEQGRGSPLLSAYHEFRLQRRRHFPQIHDRVTACNAIATAVQQEHCTSVHSLARNGDVALDIHFKVARKWLLATLSTDILPPDTKTEIRRHPTPNFRPMLYHKRYGILLPQPPYSGSQGLWRRPRGYCLKRRSGIIPRLVASHHRSFDRVHETAARTCGSSRTEQEYWDNDACSVGVTFIAKLTEKLPLWPISSNTPAIVTSDLSRRQSNLVTRDLTEYFTLGHLMSFTASQQVLSLPRASRELLLDCFLEKHISFYGGRAVYSGLAATGTTFAGVLRLCLNHPTLPIRYTRAGTAIKVSQRPVDDGKFAALVPCLACRGYNDGCETHHMSPPLVLLRFWDSDTAVGFTTLEWRDIPTSLTFLSKSKIAVSRRGPPPAPCACVAPTQGRASIVVAIERYICFTRVTRHNVSVRIDSAADIASTFPKHVDITKAGQCCVRLGIIVLENGAVNLRQEGRHTSSQNFRDVSPRLQVSFNQHQCGVGTVGNGTPHYDTSRWSSVPLYNENHYSSLNITRSHAACFRQNVTLVRRYSGRNGRLIRDDRSRSASGLDIVLVDTTTLVESAASLPHDEAILPAGGQLGLARALSTYVCILLPLRATLTHRVGRTVQEVFKRPTCFSEADDAACQTPPAGQRLVRGQTACSLDLVLWLTLLLRPYSMSSSCGREVRLSHAAAATGHDRIFIIGSAVAEQRMQLERAHTEGSRKLECCRGARGPHSGLSQAAVAPARGWSLGSAASEYLWASEEVWADAAHLAPHRLYVKQAELACSFSRCVVLRKLELNARAGETGDPPENPAGQRHRSARLPRVKIRGRRRRELNPASLGERRSSKEAYEGLCARVVYRETSLPRRLTGDYAPEAILVAYSVGFPPAVDSECSARVAICQCGYLAVSRRKQLHAATSRSGGIKKDGRKERKARKRKRGERWRGHELALPSQRLSRETKQLVCARDNPTPPPPTIYTLATPFRATSHLELRLTEIDRSARQPSLLIQCFPAPSSALRPSATLSNSRPFASSSPSPALASTFPTITTTNNSPGGRPSLTHARLLYTWGGDYTCCPDYDSSAAAQCSSRRTPRQHISTNDTSVASIGRQDFSRTKLDMAGPTTFSLDRHASKGGIL